jgi:alpha-tubulin suppressor-like RCC1 family protein
VRAALLLLAGCYHGASELSCKIRCPDNSCPSGLTCVAGYCTSGEDCAPDGGMACGGVGQACCATPPACVDNGYCVAGQCQPGCVIDVALGRWHSCVVEHDGTVWCAGDNTGQQIGSGSASSTYVQISDSTGLITDATAAVAADVHSCAIRAGGTVWCWGTGGDGQLGNNSFNSSATAVQVVKAGLGALDGVVELAAANRFVCARDSAGAVWCWGNNGYGQLGDGSFTGRGFAAMAGVSNATSIGAGDSHACALDSSSNVWCWGRNGNGQVGNNTTVDQTTPQQVATATTLAVGAFHTCAVLADSSMQCWGANTRRWLGTGGNRTTSVPVPEPVVVAAAGASYKGAIAATAGAVTCAITSSNHVDCWADDVHGQAGNGGAAYPEPVLAGKTALSSIDKLSAHYAHVCAHHTDGRIVCWGRNAEGEFGTGETENHGEPVPLGATCQ